MKMTLTVDGLEGEATEFKVQNCGYSFQKATGKSGRATSQVMGGQINLTLYPEWIDKNGTTQYTPAFVQWMLDGSKAYDGTIMFYANDDETKEMKQIDFKKGFCVALSEGIQAESGERLSQSITISTLSIEVHGKGDSAAKVTYNNMWQGDK